MIAWEKGNSLSYNISCVLSLWQIFNMAHKKKKVLNFKLRLRMKKIINIFFSGELNKEEKPRNHYEKSNPDLRILRSFALSLRSRKLSGEQGHCKVHVWPASWKLTTTNTNVDNVEWVSEWSQKRMINYELSRCHSKCHITFNLSSQKTLLLKRRDMFYLSFTFVITEVFDKFITDSVLLLILDLV